MTIKNLKMRQLSLILSLLFLTMMVFGQSGTATQNDIGISYYGELGLRPGIEIDYGIPLSLKRKERKRRMIEKQIKLRPTFAYYHYPHYSNNLLMGVSLNRQLQFIIKKNGKYFFFEHWLKVGYLRYFFTGDVFETDGNGFKEVNFRGSNSFIAGGAFQVGGYISKKVDWLFGFDYYAEKTEDQLILHRFFAKVGIRIKLNLKSKSK